MFESLLSKCKGNHYTLCDNWMFLVKMEPFVARPIRYLEIGAYHGTNIICVAHSYAAHTESQLFCVDPWTSYTQYPEPTTGIEDTFQTFRQNLQQFPNVVQKLKAIRGYSHAVLPSFENDFFDLIYVDGNHQPEYVLEDGVLAFRKLKQNGIMIFDDYNFGGLDVTKRGIDAFLTAYRDRIEYIGFLGGQIFIRKK